MKIEDLSPAQRGHLHNKASAALQGLAPAGPASATYAERVLWEGVLEACKGKPAGEPATTRRRRRRRRGDEESEG